MRGRGRAMRGLWGSLAGSIGVAMMSAVIAWALGVNWVQSLLVAAVVVTLGAGASAGSIIEGDPAWPRASDGRQGGTRREVTGLSWSFSGRRGFVASAALGRLQTLAARRLAHRGIDLNDPDQADAVTSLVGASAYTVLMSRASRSIRYSAFARAVAAVERLDETGVTATAATGDSPARRWSTP